MWQKLNVIISRAHHQFLMTIPITCVVPDIEIMQIQ